MNAERREADTLNEILAALGDVSGRAILDVGCGRGRLAAALARRGARVSAVEPGAEAMAAARLAVPEARIEQAGAEALPFGDGAFDGVVALNSLHHVPRAGMARALAEMARVVRDGAPVVVVEPLAEGSYFEAMRPLEDETTIRAAAQAAIRAACEGGPLELVAVDEFERGELFRDLDQFVEQLIAVDPARADALPAALPDMSDRFAALAAPTPQGAMLRQPHRIHRLVRRGTKPPAAG